MAHGRPDFFGASIHPKYGTSYRLAGNETVTPGDIRTVVTQNAKGVLAGAYLYTNDADSDISDQPGLQIDGNRIVGNSYLAMITWGILPGTKQPMVLLRYDPDVPSFAAGFPLELPFEKSFTFQYIVAGVNPVTVAYYITYYSLE